MGSGGPGNITHIDNLYVKTVACKTNINILLGEYVIFDTDGYRPVVVGDFSADDRFLDINSETAGGVDGVFQAVEDANNLTTTPVVDRKTEVSVATTGTDWVTKIAASVRPSRRVGISRLDARTPIIATAAVANSLAPTLDESLGVYKHKEFARLAAISVLNDDAIIATGQVN